MVEDIVINEVIAAVETILLCALLFFLCYLGTGTDEKNLKSYSTYPDEVQERLKEIPEYNGRLNEKNKVIVFVSNLVLFLIVLFVLGIFVRRKEWWINILNLTMIGQGLNLFDLFVIDLLWWRRTKRIRFASVPQKELYQNPRKHVESFLRALVMYLLIALLDGFLLTLF